MVSKYVTFKGKYMKKSERLNQELIFLNNKYSFQLKDLMHEFSISKRTALRDIEALESIGLALYSESGRAGGYRIINQDALIPIYFSDEEIQSIFFALNALNLLSSTPFEKSYPKIQKKLFQTLSEDKQKNISAILKVVHYYNIAPVKKIDNLEQILKSILAERPAVLTYTQFKATKIKIQIYELFYRNGIWFTSAYDFDSHLWGTYRCDYMSDLKIDVDSPTTFSLEDLKQMQITYEENFHNIPFKCKLTKFGKELFQKNHYPNMHLEEQNGISYIVGGYNESEIDYMVHYLITFGTDLQIEFPKQLKRSYLVELQKIINQYQ
ncbi:transcriptional regulator [Pediococcus stilesii]|uniref:Transcriptional regulator n=2 Tax=Pediococcus stilesii TaxID=331679 RepID=A0A0R2KUT5_9LACO|nr:transcriptional regulator [Pediococcus stilesii]